MFGASAVYPGSPYAPAGDSLETLTPGAKSAVVHVPAAGGAPQSASFSWTTKFTGAPSAVSVSIQGANVDSDASYSTIDTSTNTAGETRTKTAQAFKFYRAIINSATGGTGIELTFTVTGAA